MYRFSIILLVLGLAWVTSALGANGARMALTVHQWDEADSGEVLLYADTADFTKDVNVTGFMVGLSVDVKVAAVDTAAVQMAVHVHTFAPQPSHAARNFQVEYGLPARVDDLTGKHGNRYRLTLTPLEPIEIDTAVCPFSQYSTDDFQTDPTAHMNIYYVPQTLGDFHWNAVKGMLEEEYENFRRMVNFGMPGKYMLYLCPCKLNTIIWDDRFGMMIDPVRSTMYAIYDKSYNSVYPFVISQAAVYRNYGYAPAFLADGFANYLSFAIYDVKKLKAEGGLVPLDSLLDSYAYFQADARTADGISATFVRWLVDQYRVGTFLELYKQADDLNLREKITEIYGQSLEELEAGWLTYLDTVPLAFSQFGYHALQAEAMMDYSRAHEYTEKMMPLATNLQDSLQTLNQLTRAGFYAGDYYAATENQQKLLTLVGELPPELMKLAAYRMMNGEYGQAAAILERAAGLDSTNSLVTFNQALNQLCQGDTLRARQIFSSVVEGGGAFGGLIESQIMLANIIARSGDADDKALATTHYNSAIGTLERQDRKHDPSPSHVMWLGIAYLGAGDTGSAQDYLQTALFLETREFYLGMINLWLGKVADVRGERAVARDYYQRVLAGSSSHYHQEEARRLLETPFRQ